MSRHRGSRQMAQEMMKIPATSTSKRLGFLLAALLTFGLWGCDSMMGGDGPGTHDEPPTVAVLLDGSPSFLPKIDEAQDVTVRFLARNSVNGTAKIFIYRIDHDPRLVEAIGQYDYLKKSTKDLVASIKNPVNQPGTDIVGALEMALTKLRTSGSGPKHMLVFTDGIVYSPIVGGQRLGYTPLEEFDWSRLEGIQTRFYFLEARPYRVLTEKALPVLSDLKLYEDAEGADPKQILRAVEDY